MMENSIIVLRDLIKMTEEELFFRGYHKASEKGMQQHYLRITDSTEDWRNIVFDIEKYYALETENMFMKPNRNIGIQKHPRYLPYFTHSHTFFEIAYVLFGSCRQMIEGKPLHLSEGDFCMLAPGVRHGIEIMDDDTIMLNILIRYDIFVDIFYSTLRNKSQISTFFNSCRLSG